jgi:hypothetical protein
MQKHVAIFRSGAPRTPGLEEVLQADVDFALDATDRLLKLTREEWIGVLDTNRILQSLVVQIYLHFPLGCENRPRQ